MNNTLKARFSAISQKIIAVDEFEQKADQLKTQLSLTEKSLVTINSGLKMVTIGFGEIAKDILGLPANIGAYEDAQGKFYITGKQLERSYLSFAFNDALSEKILDAAEQCQDHSASTKSGQLKKFILKL